MNSSLSSSSQAVVPANVPFGTQLFTQAATGVVSHKCGHTPFRNMPPWEKHLLRGKGLAQLSALSSAKDASHSMNAALPHILETGVLIQDTPLLQTSRPWVVLRNSPIHAWYFAFRACMKLGLACHPEKTCTCCGFLSPREQHTDFK